MGKKIYSFADKYKEIKDRYNKKGLLDKGDPIAVSSFKREVNALKEKQEAIKQQMEAEKQAMQQQMQQSQQMQDPNMQMRYGGKLVRKFEGGGDRKDEYTAEYYGNTAEASGRGDMKKYGFKITDPKDAIAMSKANEVFKKNQAALRGVYQKEGNDIKLDRLKQILGSEAYKQLEDSYNTLTTITKKYGINPQSFGINDPSNSTGSNLPQWYGPRFDATAWNINGPTGEVTIDPGKQTANTSYSWKENQIDPYRINPFYDTASLAASTIPLLNERNVADPLKFDRVTPGYVSYENEREQARRDATLARNTGLNNIRNTANSSGQALANAAGMQMGLQGILGNNLASSQEREANANAAIYGNVGLQNANIQRLEALQNYEDRRYVDENQKMRNRNIGSNFSDYMQRLKGNKFAELNLASMDPNYMFDINGNYVARRTPVQNTIYNTEGKITEQFNPSIGIQNNQDYRNQPVTNIQPYNPLIADPYDQGFTDIEITNPLNVSEGQYLWKKYGGKLKRRY